MSKKDIRGQSADLAYWLELREKTCERNHNFRQRNVTGTFETVNYSGSNSPVTLWINREPGGYPLHWHKTVEFIMPIEGSYTIVINKIRYRLNAGDILLIPPGELHELLPEASGLRMILLFDLSSLSIFSGFTMLFSLMSHASLITPETMPDVYRDGHELLRRVAEEYSEDDQLSEPSILAYLIRFFVLLARSSQFSAVAALPSVQSNKQREYVEKFNVVFNYIEHNYTEDISLENVASQIGFSKFHFSRLFRQFTDTSFYDYLCLRRLKAAETLLLNPALPITDVALQSGFTSISTFNRVFKKFKECTPTEFKEFYTVTMNSKRKAAAEDSGKAEDLPQ